MPTMETKPITVTLTIEVDGHTLTFSAVGEAKGAFYHGEKPAYRWNEVMEEQIRGVADTLIARAAKDATRFLTNAYPVHTRGSGSGPS